MDYSFDDNLTSVFFAKLTISSGFSPFENTRIVKISKGELIPME
jgi:hypothetical protein